MTRKNPNKNIFTFSGALSKNDPSLQDYEPEAINYYQTIRNFTNDEYCDLFFA